MHKTRVGAGDSVILTECKQTQYVQYNPKHSVAKHVTTLVRVVINNLVNICFVLRCPDGDGGHAG